MMTCLNNISRMCAIAAAVLLLLAPASARGQSAPAGNEHPETRRLTEVEVVNPFAVAAPAESGGGETAIDKAAFAKQIDLTPLRDLAVFHNGRVKILDTLARESVQSITGKKAYFDYVVKPGSDGAALRRRFDPMFTWLDLMIDPGHYATRPLIGVDYLPLREAFLERLFTSESEIEWWKRDGRLKPVDIQRVWPDVVRSSSVDQPTNRALNRMDSAIQLYTGSWQNLLVIAPTSRDQPWRHIGTLPADAPARRALDQLAAAWRAGNAAGVNAAAGELARALPAINAEMYPTTKRSVERWYNGANAFEWGFWLYALALLMLLLAFGTGRRMLAIAGGVALIGGLGFHSAGFIARCIIAERFAIQNQFESMTGLSLFAVLVGTVIMLIRRQWLFGAAAAGVGFMILVTATQTGIPGVRVEREAPILNTSVLLKYHVTTVLISYGLIALGFIVSLFYLVTHYAGRFRAGAAGTVALGSGGTVEVSAAALGLNDDAPKGSARVLSDLDKAQMIILQLAFWTLGVGILLGAWWADHSWGRWWAFDPKELWALVTWIVYLIVIHLRFATGRNRALVTAWLSVVGFFVMLWTYFGVNLLLPGLHAYA